MAQVARRSDTQDRMGGRGVPRLGVLLLGPCPQAGTTGALPRRGVATDCLCICVMAALIALLLICSWLAWFLSQPQRARWRRQALRARPFPAAWRSVLREHVPLYRRLPSHLQLRLQKQMQVFLAEVPFIGCQGLEVSQEMRVRVAALACLLVLHREEAPYPGLRQVLLYPGPFVVPRQQHAQAGVVHSWRAMLSGESWSQGQVILSWQDVQANARQPGHHNVVIHEFAHQLDYESGPANGTPAMVKGAANWPATMQAAYERLRHQAQLPAHLPPGSAMPIGPHAPHGHEAGHSSWLLDPYGAQSPAEFFAVATEAYFEAPAELMQGLPQVYAALQDVYGLDPLNW